MTEKTKYNKLLDIYIEFNKEVTKRIENLMSNLSMNTEAYEILDEELKILQNATNVIRAHSVDFVHNCHVDDELKSDNSRRVINSKYLEKR
jgi:hypothetical protein